MCFDVVVWMVGGHSAWKKSCTIKRFCGKPLEDLAEPGVSFGKIGLLRKNELE